MVAGNGSPPYRSLSSVRRLGYRLLPGDLFSYVLHMRPAEWPIMAAHTFVGYLLAVGLDGLFWGDAVGDALWALFIWVILLNGGTLAINSVFDRDEGDIGYLKSPPEIPKYLLEFSVGLLVGGWLLSFSLPAGFRWAYTIALVMSVLYSVPPFRFKAVAGVDWLINMWGFGTLTPYAAFAATGRSLDVVSGLVLLAFCPLFAGLYPLTQLYQFEEDRARGDRTLALILGLRRSLWVAIAAVLAAHTLLSIGWVLREDSGYRFDPGIWGLAGIVLSLSLWLWVLLPWYRNRDVYTPDQHQRGMYQALAAWAVTDLVVVFGFTV